MGIAGDIYDGGGAKPMSFRSVGDSVEGHILSIQSKQLEVFGKQGVLEVWPNGDPKMTPIVRIQTELSEDEEDDGQRDVYLRNNAYTAFGQAMRDAYDHKPEDRELIGATLQMEFYKAEPSGKGADRKLFTAKLTPNSAVSDAWDDTGEEPPPAEDPGYEDEGAY